MKEDFRIGEELAGSAEGLRFVRSFVSGFDVSGLAYLKVAEGSDGSIPGVYGICRFPNKDRGRTPRTRTMYRISCFVRGPFPAPIVTRKRPLYRNEDGSFPAVPDGLFARGIKALGAPPEKAWLMLGGETKLADAGETVVWICVHELYHYLRATRQVSGRNAEIEADAFADARLEAFRRGRGAGRGCR